MKVGRVLSLALPCLFVSLNAATSLTPGENMDTCYDTVILCKAFSGEQTAKEFDRLVARYFEKNNLGTEYLSDFTKSHSQQITAILDDSLRGSIRHLATIIVNGFNIGVISRTFANILGQDKYAINYLIHRFLGALEFLAIVTKSGGQWTSFFQAVLAGTFSSMANTDTDMISVIQRIGTLSDEGFKKSLLQLIGRSAWTRNEKPMFLKELIEDLKGLVPDTSKGVIIRFEGVEKWTKCAVDAIDALLTDPTWRNFPDPWTHLGTKILTIIQTHYGNHIPGISEKLLCENG